MCMCQKPFAPRIHCATHAQLTGNSNRLKPRRGIPQVGSIKGCTPHCNKMAAALPSILWPAPHVDAHPLWRIPSRARRASPAAKRPVIELGAWTPQPNRQFSSCVVIGAALRTRFDSGTNARRMATALNRNSRGRIGSAGVSPASAISAARCAL